jgi:adapter protein MecA 1/2
MKVERIARDKVRIFVSYEDLALRGIDKDELWRNGKKVQELFWDMMETAYSEVGFEVSGPIAVEAFTMPSEGVVIIVTRVPAVPPIGDEEEELDEDYDDSYDYEQPQVTTFKFYDFEDVLRVAFAMNGEHILCSLYAYEGNYYLVLNGEEELDQNPNLHYVLTEYGDASNTSLAFLQEYGKCVLTEQALQQLNDKFTKPE